MSRIDEVNHDAETLARTNDVPDECVAGRERVDGHGPAVSLWAGIGGSREAGVSTFAKDAKQLGAQLTVPLLPLALRADALLLGNDFKTDNLSYNVNARRGHAAAAACSRMRLRAGVSYVIAPNSPEGVGLELRRRCAPWCFPVGRVR